MIDIRDILFLIVLYSIRCVCEIGAMEEFQVHHANGGRYVECSVLRCVIGNTSIYDIVT